MAIITGQDDAGINRTVQTDPNGYLINLEEEHHKIHDGDHYFFSDLEEGLDIGAPKYWLIRTGEYYYVHMIILVNFSKNGKLEFFENPTITDDGTFIDSKNNNRTSNNVSLTKHYANPTVSSDGTRLYVEVIGTDGNNINGNIGGVKIRGNEIILQQDTTYLIKATTLTDGARVSIRTEYYDVNKQTLP